MKATEPLDAGSSSLADHAFLETLRATSSPRKAVEAAIKTYLWSEEQMSYAWGSIELYPSIEQWQKWWNAEDSGT